MSNGGECPPGDGAEPFEAALTEEERRERIQDIQAEVRDHIAKRAEHWKKLESTFHDFFKAWESDDELKSAIYRVYARSDKQKGPHPYMKDAEKIVEETVLRRLGGRRVRNGNVQIIEPNEAFEIKEMTDIAGVSIVCPFPSDVERVKARIEALAQSGQFGILDRKGHERDEYTAYHFVLTKSGAPFQGLKIEAQVKTAIQDAFGWKTHQLAYKPRNPADVWFVEQFRRINVVLRSADEMSDQLRDRLLRENSYGVKRREQARLELKTRLKESAARHSKAKDPAEREARKRTRELFKELERASKLSNRDRDSALDALTLDIEALLKDRQGDKNVFRLAAVHVIESGRSDMLHWLRDWRTTWVRNKTPEGAAEDVAVLEATTSTCCLAHYCAGDLSEAIQMGCALARKFLAANNHQGARLAVNTAYYCAEYYGLSPDADEYSLMASELIEGARELLGVGFTEPMQDTQGYVAIQTGKTVADIEGGLDLCRAANRAIMESDSIAAHKNLATAYFDLHKEIAYYRLAEILNEGATRRSAHLAGEGRAP